MLWVGALLRLLVMLWVGAFAEAAGDVMGGCFTEAAVMGGCTEAAGDDGWVLCRDHSTGDIMGKCALLKLKAL